jgi:tripartite-type tricarboxylate transporter receptor subunit TctC
MDAGILGKEMNNRRKLIVALVTAVTATGVCAQSKPAGYPVRPAKIIVPFPAGGATDILTRVVGQKLSERIGQQMPIDNKPGAGANIGAEAAAKSPADGYTLLMGSIASHSIAVSYYKNLNYDIRKDFAAIAMTGAITNVLVVHPALPVRSVKELIALAKARPGELNFSSSGTGGLIHLTGELFKQTANINIVHVPYKGTALFLPDLLNGQIAMSLDTLPPHLPFIKIGKLRALAVTTAKRSPVLPELPTIAEAALPGFESVAIYALLAPTGTPKEIVAYLNRETNAVLQLPDIREKLAAQGIETLGGTPEAVDVIIRKEVAKWARVIKEAGITPE